VKRKMISVIFTLLFVLLLAGCKDRSRDAAYQDGTYVGKSSEDDQGAYGEATITIEENKITDCSYVTRQKDGTVKDENYGKVNGTISNQDYYDKAQLAVKAMEQYAAELAEVQKLDDVDAVSGATIAYNQFKEAVEDALSQAEQAK
jgi:major membrane immunogen (membrane-anchored lipoprotein)